MLDCPFKPRSKSCWTVPLNQEAAKNGSSCFSPGLRCLKTSYRVLEVTGPWSHCELALLLEVLKQKSQTTPQPNINIWFNMCIKTSYHCTVYRVAHNSMNKRLQQPPFTCFLLYYIFLSRWARLTPKTFEDWSNPLSSYWPISVRTSIMID